MKRWLSRTLLKIPGNEISTTIPFNLSVQDQKNSMRFQEMLGYGHNPQITDGPQRGYRTMQNGVSRSGYVLRSTMAGPREPF